MLVAAKVIRQHMFSLHNLISHIIIFEKKEDIILEKKEDIIVFVYDNHDK